MGNSKKAKVIGFASFALGAMLFALSYSAEAQQPEKVPHITELAYLPPESRGVPACEEVKS